MTIRVVSRPARLSWRNFKSVGSIPDSDEEAQTAQEMIFPRISVKQVNGKFRLADFTVTVATQPADTLVVRTADRSSELLDHEQGHFDLLVLAARAMALDLEKAEADSPEDLQQVLEEIKTTHGDRAIAIDAEYDEQTRHNRDAVQQRRWRKLINDAMTAGNATQLAGMTL